MKWFQFMLKFRKGNQPAAVGPGSFVERLKAQYQILWSVFFLRERTVVLLVHASHRTMEGKNWLKPIWTDSSMCLIKAKTKRLFLCNLERRHLLRTHIHVRTEAIGILRQLEHLVRGCWVSAIPIMGKQLGSLKGWMLDEPASAFQHETWAFL